MGEEKLAIKSFSFGKDLEYKKKKICWRSGSQNDFWKPDKLLELAWTADSSLVDVRSFSHDITKMRLRSTTVKTTRKCWKAIPMPKALTTFSSATRRGKSLGLCPPEGFLSNTTNEENQYRFSSLLSLLRITSTYPVEVGLARLRPAPLARCNGNLKLFLSLNAIKSKRHSHAERRDLWASIDDPSVLPVLVIPIRERR